MRLIHTADLHLGSPLGASLTDNKAKLRRAELQGTLHRLCDEARRVSAEGIIIAGDLFDMDKPQRIEVESFLSVVRANNNILFFVLFGNHDSKAVLSTDIPKNLYLFSEKFTEFRLGEVSLIGKSGIAKDALKSLHLERGRKNIVALHASLGGAGDDGISLSDIRHLGIDYLALGHYHKYSYHQIDERGIAVYSGTPEGRGFDEAHECGYVLIDTDGKIKHKFIPFAKRRILSITVDISSALSSYDVEIAIRDAIKNIDSESIIRVTLTGHRSKGAVYDTDYLCQMLWGGFFYLEIKDNSSLDAKSSKDIYDKSLKGEFLRLASASLLDDDMRRRVIDIGLRALSGEDLR